MPVYSLNNHFCKYSVYLSETFQALQSNPDVYPEIIEQITRAGLLYFSVDKTSGIQSGLDKFIKEGIDDADIFVLYASSAAIDVDSHKGKPTAELEYDYAKNAGKPVLVYLDRDYRQESSAAYQWIGEIQRNETYNLINQETDLPLVVTADLLKLILKKSDLSFWIHSDISPAKIESIVKQKKLLDGNLHHVGELIQKFEKRLNDEQRDQILGPLIDIEMYPNISGQAYCFAAKQTPANEIKHEGLSYHFCIDRFEPYEGDAVYDRQLKVTWLKITNQNFSWLDAVDWRNKLSPENLKKVAELTAGSEDWRLPDIEELMTLICECKQEEDYFDKTLYSGDVHWFWSGTAVKDEQKAFYIETTQGSVLKDELSHMNAILLRCSGRPTNLGNLIYTPGKSSAEEEETEILRQANRSRHIYGIFLSIFQSAQINNGLVNELQHSLHRSGYAVDCNLTKSSRTVMKEDSVLSELENNDAYVLVLDRTATPDMLDSARLELCLARSLHLPIFIYHNVSNAQLASWSGNLGLAEEGVDGLATFKDAQNLAAELVPVLSKFVSQSSSPGLIRHNEFESIKACIEKINHHRSLQDACEPLLKKFIKAIPVNNLQPEFEKYGIVFEKPVYGEQTWFVSSDNPLQRFFLRGGLKQSYELPILFEKFPNRFASIEKKDDCCIVYDHYLKLKWWTIGVKKTSYQEALDYAQQVSDQQKENWRLPTVEEMATLLTRSRINRKYMDEEVFPLGRWFWTSSCVGKMVYYVDFNYLDGSIRLEDLSKFKDEFPTLRKKTVILVCYDSKLSEPGPVLHPSEHEPQNLQKGAKPVDPVLLSIPILSKTVDFLFGEVAKILDERRENRKEQKEMNKGSQPTTGEALTEPSPVPIKKEELLSLGVNQKVWLERKGEIEHLYEMLQIYIDNYRLVEKQIAMVGEIHMPQEKMHQLKAAEKGMIETTRKLEAELSKIFGMEINLE
ncbi:MAG: DUF1566 domain-containing protein [Anaerolineaceae bacterium]|nr:DUF1566 domain-containing protein [Anaerolineaceae bacterium]